MGRGQALANTRSAEGEAAADDDNRRAPAEDDKGCGG